jgi:hypothetical protein
VKIWVRPALHFLSTTVCPLALKRKSIDRIRGAENTEIFLGENKSNEDDIFRNTYWVAKTKLRGFSPQANYTDRATAAFRRS